MKFSKALILALGIFAGCAFDGMKEINIVTPPDTYIAVGFNHIVETVNFRMRIYDKVGKHLLTKGYPVSCPGHEFSFDGRIVYDFLTNRWLFVSATNSSGINNQPSFWCLGVSQTSDPTGSWYQYQFTAPYSPTDFPDYPGIGVDDDKVVLTGNFFSGTGALILNKSQLLVGAAVATQFVPELYGFLFQVARPTSSTKITTIGVIATPITYLLGFNFFEDPISNLAIRFIRGVPGVGMGVQSTTAQISFPSGLKHELPQNVPQAGTSILLDVGSQRMYDAVFRNGILWGASHEGCKPPGDSVTRTCLRFFQLRILESPFKTAYWGYFQEDFRFATSGVYYFYPAIQIDADLNLITVFNRSSASEYPSIYASGQYWSPINLTNALIPPRLLKASPSFYASHNPVPGSIHRWGDYSGAALDPAFPRRAWVAAEYALSPTQWGTWISQVGKEWVTQTASSNQVVAVNPPQPPPVIIDTSDALPSETAASFETIDIRALPLVMPTEIQPIPSPRTYNNLRR